MAQYSSTMNPHPVSHFHPCLHTQLPMAHTGRKSPNSLKRKKYQKKRGKESKLLCPSFNQDEVFLASMCHCQVFTARPSFYILRNYCNIAAEHHQSTVKIKNSFQDKGNCFILPDVDKTHLNKNETQCPKERNNSNLNQDFLSEVFGGWFCEKEKKRKKV